MGWTRFLWRVLTSPGQPSQSFDEPLEPTPAMRACLAAMYRKTALVVGFGVILLVLLVLAMVQWARASHWLEALGIFGVLILATLQIFARPYGRWRGLHRARRSPDLRRLSGPVHNLRL